jgi:Txe/YoeB family toxin of Txe-Axe toxin-antitoxin module
MANAKKTWKEVFLENYSGKSEIAKEVEPFIKENYKGNSYIPWATMERLTYMCDENAVFENIKNEQGGLVHTDKVEMHQQNIQKGEVVSETTSQMFSHMVKVKLVFMGKEFIEEYPIQDQDYTAARVYNQNLVNKALQRAKAKVAARATGIGLKLYEGKDLQFDEVPQETKPEIPVVENAQNSEKIVQKDVEKPKNAQKTEKIVKKVEKVEEKPQEIVQKPEPVKEVATQVETQPVTQNDAVSEAIDLIKNTEVDKMNLALQRVNVALMKKHRVALSTEASKEELRSILENKTIFTNPDQFLKTLKTLLGM